MSTKPKLNFNVLHALSIVSSKLEDSKLEKNTLREIKYELKQLTEYFMLNTNQCILLTVIYSLNYKRNRNIDLDEMSKFLGLNPLNLLMYKKQLDYMLENGYITSETNLSSMKIAMATMRFSISEEVSNAIIPGRYISCSIW